MRLFGPNVERLRKKGDVEGLTSLLSLDSRDKEVAKAAVQALVDLADVRAVPHLCRLLDQFVEGEGDGKEVAKAAVQALGNLADVRAVPHLCRLLNGWVLEEEAVDALSRIGGVAVTSYLVGFVEALDKDTGGHGRHNAATVAVKVGPNGIAPLTDALRNQSAFHWITREWVVDVLANIRVPASYLALEEALKDSERMIRHSAAIALAEIGREESLPSLVALLVDREFTASELGRIEYELDEHYPGWPETAHAATIVPRLREMRSMPDVSLPGGELADMMGRIHALEGGTRPLQVKVYSSREHEREVAGRLLKRIRQSQPTTQGS